MGRGVISCHFKYLAASDIRRFHMHTLIHIHKHRHITGESTYPPGLPGTEALDPHTYLYILRWYHAGSLRGSYSRKHARTHTTRTHAGPQQHAHTHTATLVRSHVLAMRRQCRVGLSQSDHSSVSQRVLAKTDMIHESIGSCCFLMRPFVPTKSAVAAANASE